MRPWFKVLCLFVACAGFAADDIRGFWKVISEEGKTQCIIAIYDYDGLCYGRIIGSFDETGKKMIDTIERPVKRASGIASKPYYSGLDIIWDLIDSGSKFKGKIMDPQKGDVYNAELWVDGTALVVRGKLFFFGRSQTWLPASKSDFPTDFKQPDVSTFVPAVYDEN